MMLHVKGSADSSRVRQGTHLLLIVGGKEIFKIKCHSLQMKGDVQRCAMEH